MLLCCITLSSSRENQRSAQEVARRISGAVAGEVFAQVLLKLNDVENYNINYQTPAHYGQYVPLVHVLNYGSIHGDGMIRFFTTTTSVHLLHKFF